MKKTLIAMTLLAGAVSVYSQGYIMMGNYNSDLFSQPSHSGLKAGKIQRISSKNEECCKNGRRDFSVFST